MEKNHKLFYSAFPHSTSDTRKMWVTSRYDLVYSYRLKQGRKLTEVTFRTTKTYNKVPYQVYFSPARLQNQKQHGLLCSVYQGLWKIIAKQKETYYLSSWREAIYSPSCKVWSDQQFFLVQLIPTNSDNGFYTGPWSFSAGSWPQLYCICPLQLLKNFVSRIIAWCNYWCPLKKKELTHKKINLQELIAPPFISPSHLTLWACFISIQHSYCVSQHNLQEHLKDHSQHRTVWTLTCLRKPKSPVTPAWCLRLKWYNNEIW